MNDYEFLLEDRIAKIRAINEQYDLENNSYIAFSGGKDSTVLHYLIDLALPNNKIPRVYANTGIEYVDMVKFVKGLSLNDDRVLILNQKRNIKKTLEEYGYPFKSKEHSLRVSEFNKNHFSKFIIKYITGKNEDGTDRGFSCPKILKYQFEGDKKYNYSKECCHKLKKDLMFEYQKASKKKINLTGMRAEEGGTRANANCILLKDGKLVRFHPLLVVSEDWENWFINKYNIKLCKLYYPPYNFKRTGCKGCPYNMHLQEDLDTLKKLLPNEYKQCEILWKPVYEEYRRIGYRLQKEPRAVQYTLDDYIKEYDER